MIDAQDASKTTTNASAGALIEQGINEGKPAEAVKLPTDQTKVEGEKPGDVKPGDGAALPEFMSRKDAESLIAKGVADAIAKHSADLSQTSVRDSFIVQKMADLPFSVVQSLMPKTGDVKALAAAEQQIRGELSEWFKKNAAALGMKDKEVSGGVTTGGISSDFSGRGQSTATATDLVQAGLRQQG